jgi:hypothetical protein
MRHEIRWRLLRPEKVQTNSIAPLAEGPYEFIEGSEQYGVVRRHSESE